MLREDFMLCAKQTQQWWPTTPNTVGCYILHLFAHPVACFWELLRKVWNRSNLKLCTNGHNNSQQCSICLHGALHLTAFLFHWQVIHLKRFQLVNNHWVKSNKIVQFPMEGFDPSALLAKPSRNGTSSAISSDGGVTTVNVKSSEELVNEEETEERKEATTRQGSEVSRDIALSVWCDKVLLRVVLGISWDLSWSIIWNNRINPTNSSWIIIREMSL